LAPYAMSSLIGALLGKNVSCFRTFRFNLIDEFANPIFVYRFVVPDIYSDIDLSAIRRPALMNVSVEQNASIIHRSELWISMIDFIVVWHMVQVQSLPLEFVVNLVKVFFVEAELSELSVVIAGMTAVMISSDQDFSPIQPWCVLFHGAGFERKIAEIKYDVIAFNEVVPLLDERFIHLLYGFEGTIAVCNDFCVSKVVI